MKGYQELLDEADAIYDALEHGNRNEILKRLRGIQADALRSWAKYIGDCSNDRCERCEQNKYWATQLNEDADRLDKP